MDKQRKADGLGWLDKLAIKNGSLLLTGLAIAVPIYTRFVTTEQSLNELRKSVDKLSGVVESLRTELQQEKSNNALVALRLSVVEHQLTQPRLLR